MKHAYLILAHDDFSVLSLLVSLLDDPRNDIYIHFDLKVEQLPDVQVFKSRLFILSERVKVHWGDVSVIQAEYLLYRSSFKNGPYDYYHLLSAVDLPLKNQNYIHDFFSRNTGKQFIGFSNYDYSAELARKVNYYHLFAKSFRESNSIAKRLVRAAFLRLQMLIGLKWKSKVVLKKGTQWVSVSHDFIALLLEKQQQVISRYAHTFCADEIYKQTICWNSKFMDDVYNPLDEAQGSMRAIRWENAEIKAWSLDDYSRLAESEFLFARKFSSKDTQALNKITKTL